MTNPITNWFFKGQNTRIPNEATARWGNPLDYFKKNPDPTTLFGDDALQVGRSDKNFAAGRRGNPFGRPDQAFNPFRPADKGGPFSGPTPLGREVVLRGIPFLSKYLGAGLTGAQLFGQGQEGSLLDQATEAMPDLQVGGFGINNNPETDVGKRVWDFLSNKASEIGVYTGGAKMEPIGTYKGGAEIAPLRMAGVPRYIKYGGPPNSIIKAPHVDSPLVDKWLHDYRLRDTFREPQLPNFV